MVLTPYQRELITSSKQKNVMEGCQPRPRNALMLKLTFKGGEIFPVSLGGKKLYLFPEPKQERSITQQTNVI